MLTRPTRLFSGDYILALRGAGPSNFYTLQPRKMYFKSDVGRRAASCLALPHISSYCYYNSLMVKAELVVVKYACCWQKLFKTTWLSNDCQRSNETLHLPVSLLPSRPPTSQGHVPTITVQCAALSPSQISTDHTHTHRHKYYTVIQKIRTPLYFCNNFFKCWSIWMKITSLYSLGNLLSGDVVCNCIFHKYSLYGVI